MNIDEIEKDHNDDIADSTFAYLSDALDRESALIAMVRQLEAVPKFGGVCPKCDGKGEVYVGASFPDDEGFTNCEYCIDGTLPTLEQYAEQRQKSEGFHYEQQAKIEFELEPKIKQLEADNRAEIEIRKSLLRRIDVIEADKAGLVEALGILLPIGADSGLYESEYDGTTYTFCKGCNYQDDCRPIHADTCTYKKSTEALAKHGGKV